MAMGQRKALRRYNPQDLEPVKMWDGMNERGLKVSMFISWLDDGVLDQ